MAYKATKCRRNMSNLLKYLKKKIKKKVNKNKRNVRPKEGIIWRTTLKYMAIFLDLASMIIPQETG
jgi:hypothetical protein